LNGTPHCIDDALKLSQHAIACVFDYSAAVFTDFGIHECIQMLFEPDMCSLFVSARQAAVAHNVGRQNSRYPAL
jgi:hypothetical protein